MNIFDKMFFAAVAAAIVFYFVFCAVEVVSCKM